MFDLTAANAAAYLAAKSTITELGGGISNTVLLVESPGGRFVLKQALGKLRVEQDWFADRRRIHREAVALRLLEAKFPAGAVPGVLFEDRENFLFAMTAAPAAAQTWKTQLLSGDIRPEIAAQIGRLLVAMASTEPPAEFADQTLFDQLRLDPYYRSTALAHPDLQPFFDGLIKSYQSRRIGLVHGDWSPKNFLVHGDSVMAIDFEAVHHGDPSFDAAFMLSHLLLKSFHRPQWRAQFSAAARAFWNIARTAIPESPTIQHLGALLLARMDGKSPAEYIAVEERPRIRSYARSLIQNPPATVEAIFA